MLAIFTVLSLLTASALCEQIDYQPQIDTYQNLFACSYLAKYNLDTHVNRTFTEDDFPSKDRLKLFYKMVSHCRDKISLQTSAQLIQTGFDYDDKFAQTMGEQVKTLTNYGPFVRNRGALALSERDKETVDLLFEISKNEGERHGKMPTFGRNGKPISEKPASTQSEKASSEKPATQEKPKAEKPVDEKAPEKPVVTEKPSAKPKPAVDEDEVKVVEQIKKEQQKAAEEEVTQQEEEQEDFVEAPKKPIKRAENHKRRATPKRQLQEEDEEDLSEVDAVPTKKKTPTPPAEDQASLLDRLLDPKSLLVVTVISMFLLYQRNQNKQMEMMLRMKELELQAAIASAKASPLRHNETPEPKKKR